MESMQHIRAGVNEKKGRFQRRPFSLPKGSVIDSGGGKGR
jgi:hypothetical protein